MIVLALTAGLLLAAMLTAVGLRGRPVDDHPLCRRCGFDLTGRPAATTTCGECGADLTRPRATSVGPRRWRRVPLAAGLAVGGPVLVTAGVLVWGAAVHVDWPRHAPLGLLLRRAASADAAVRSPALNEVLRRVTGGLTGTDYDRAADAALAAQADPARPWDARWGAVLEDGHGAGRLSDDRWRRYAARAWPGVFSLSVRPTVRRGDPLPYTLHLRAGRVAVPSVLQAELHDLRWQPTGDPATRRPGRDQMTMDIQGVTVSTTPRPATCPAALPLGMQQVRLTARINVGAFSPAEEFRVMSHPAATGLLELPATVTVVAAGPPTVGVVTDPTLADAVRRSLRVEAPGRSGAGRGTGTGKVRVTASPVGLSFDVFIRRPGQNDRRIGELVCPAGARTTYSLGGSWPAVPPGTSVQVVFRPNPSLATESVNVTRVWDGQIILGVVMP